MSRYIDADILNHFDFDLFDGQLSEDAVQGIETVLNYVDLIPTAEVREVKHGKWESNDPYYGWHCSLCKECNQFAFSHDSDTGEWELQDLFCPHCGADMREEDVQMKGSE